MMSSGSDLLGTATMIGGQYLIGQEQNKLTKQLATMQNDTAQLGQILGFLTQSQLIGIQKARVDSQNAVDAAQIRMIDAQRSLQEAGTNEALRNTSVMNKIHEELQRAIADYEILKVKNLRDQTALEAEQKMLISKAGVDPDKVLNPDKGANTALVVGGLAAAGVVAYMLMGQE